MGTTKPPPISTLDPWEKVFPITDCFFDPDAEIGRGRLRESLTHPAQNRMAATVACFNVALKARSALMTASRRSASP